MVDLSGLGFKDIKHLDSNPFEDRVFLGVKRATDVAGSLVLLPVLAIACLALLVLNPFFNRGSLFFVQKRMGRNCVPFNTIKFRSMRPETEGSRSAECPLEVERITLLGKCLRKTRIDEIPQIINVLRGEMSLIGPRPDMLDHAEYYIEKVPFYRQRYAVRPGISGLAQTEVGYVTGSAETERKVIYDLYYIQNTGIATEFWLIIRTLSVMFRRKGL